MNFDADNHIFRLAVDFVNYTGRNIFLTGKAGTGKTTFLKYIRENSFKKMVVVAPTGVAAINAGGVTMHSFFQLPFGPFTPTTETTWNETGSQINNIHTLFKNIRFNKGRRDLLLEMDLLVIDEVSMVRADLLDAVDVLLRHFRMQPLVPFGGVQVLFIGDLFQLPPVVKNDEWEILKPYYKSPFFFDAQVLQQSPLIYFELKKIYRQSDEKFISILNNIRNNRVTHDDLDVLHQYYRPNFAPVKEDNYITLTSHNAKSDVINQTELQKLPAKAHLFEAEVKGEFNDKAYPADKSLQLKEGAQVMFIKNDKGESRRYFNGKIGIIKKINGDKITVHFPQEEVDIDIEKETWKNIKYNYNREQDKINEEELGSFIQYPIRLAWAITIHKSQGLTFTKAIIDAGASFAPGQVYVALSRITSLEGLVLHSPIQPHCISTDERVITFTEAELNEDALQEALEESQQKYIINELIQSFNWSKIVENLQENLNDFEYRTIPEKTQAVIVAQKLLDKAKELDDVGTKFINQLQSLLITVSETGYAQIQQRTMAGCGYFIKVIEEEILQPLNAHITEIRIRKRIKKYLQDLTELKILLNRKLTQLKKAEEIANGLQNGLNTKSLLDIVSQPSEIQTPETEEIKETETKKSTKQAKGETYKITLAMFREGKTIEQIAKERGFAISTIEGHLLSFTSTGELNLQDFVPQEKIDTIMKAFQTAPPEATTTDIKEKLGAQYSYAELRAVRQHYEKYKNDGFGMEKGDDVLYF